MHQHLTGKKAPAISLPDSNGEIFKFTPGEDHAPTIIFFYPKSGSYGCTKEACQFREALSGSAPFKSAGVKVIGISADAPKKQKAFVEKYNLNFPVLSDDKGEAREAYHVGKSLFGMSEARTTFIIDSEGVVRDSHDSLLNFGAHTKFAHTWVDKLNIESEAKKVAAAPIGEAKDLQVPVASD